jgi:hypothetical protein
MDASVMDGLLFNRNSKRHNYILTEMENDPH